jgi:hypothetical protein
VSYTCNVFAETFVPIQRYVPGQEVIIKKGIHSGKKAVFLRSYKVDNKISYTVILKEKDSIECAMYKQEDIEPLKEEK